MHHSLGVLKTDPVCWWDVVQADSSKCSLVVMAQPRLCGCFQGSRSCPVFFFFFFFSQHSSSHCCGLHWILYTSGLQWPPHPSPTPQRIIKLVPADPQKCMKNKFHPFYLLVGVWSIWSLFWSWSSSHIRVLLCQYSSSILILLRNSKELWTSLGRSWPKQIRQIWT